MPYEFKCVSRLEERMDRGLRGGVPEGFLREWVEVLERNGMEDMVGIADVEEGEMEGVEYTDLERRLSVVVREGEGGIGSGDDGSCVPTLWQSGHREASRMCHCGG